MFVKGPQLTRDYLNRHWNINDPLPTILKSWIRPCILLASDRFRSYSGISWHAYMGTTPITCPIIPGLLVIFYGTACGNWIDKRTHGFIDDQKQNYSLHIICCRRSDSLCAMWWYWKGAGWLYLLENKRSCRDWLLFFICLTTFITLDLIESEFW